MSLHYMWGGKLLSMEAFRTWSEVWEKASQAWAIFRPGQTVGEDGLGVHLLGSWHSQHRGCWRCHQGVLLRIRQCRRPFVLHVRILHARPDLGMMPVWVLSWKSLTLSSPI